jgi:hypothetical protein
MFEAARAGRTRPARPAAPAPIATSDFKAPRREMGAFMVVSPTCRPQGIAATSLFRVGNTSSITKTSGIVT